MTDKKGFPWKFAFPLLIILFSSMRAFGSAADDIALSTRVYPTNSARAMEILLSAYRDQNAGLQLIKSILYEKQFHQLYSDFLDKIPATKETADEKLQMTLILGKKEGFLTALSNYLQFYTADSVPEKYPDLLYKSDVYLEVLKENYSKDLFQIMKTSAIRMKKLNQFDRFLEDPENGKVDPQEVKKYILESWQYKQRDLRPLLEGFKLNSDPDLSVLGIYFAYLSGDFSKSLSGYPGSYLSSQANGNENRIKSLKVDLPYVFAEALFREGRYREAVRDIRRNYFPEKNDLPEIRYLCFLGMNDLKSAVAEIASMRNESKFYFYTGMGMVLENPSNGAEYLEKYVQELDESQSYLSAALLLYYSMVRKPEKTGVTAELVKKSMLFQDTIPVAELPLSYAFAQGPASSGDAIKQNATIGGYVRYRQAVEYALSGKKDEAKKIVFELIRSTNTSPVVRSLAVYRARELE